MELKVGDKITLPGFVAYPVQMELVPTEGRRWWQIWKPRMMQQAKLQTFRVVDNH